jgi:hypothetical protein
MKAEIPKDSILVIRSKAVKVSKISLFIFS